MRGKTVAHETATTDCFRSSAGTFANAAMIHSAGDNHTGCPLGSGNGARSCTTRTTTAGSLMRARSRSATRARKQEEHGAASVAVAAGNHRRAVWPGALLPGVGAVL